MVKVDRYQIVVQIPMSKTSVTLNGKKIADAKEIFTVLENYCSNEPKKAQEFKRARTLLDYAEEFNATLESIKYIGKVAEFTFSFYDIFVMAKWKEDLEEKIENKDCV